MQEQPFGRSGLRVSRLGLGTGQVGGADVDDREAGRLLNRALDLGVTFLDTAPSYGEAEERIGRHLAHRRGEFVLSTKGGYGVPGLPDWTGEVIRRGVDEALMRLRTDHLDVFFLHSCPLGVLQRDDILDACRQIVTSGKVRVAGYSGENAPLEFAVECGVFQAVQCSVNVCDQRALDGPIAKAAGRGMAVVAKRPLANAPWRFSERPAGDYAEEYWRRLQAMALTPGELPWEELFLRFAAFAPGVSTAIAGTRRIENLEANLRALEKGPLPAATLALLRDTFRRADRGWEGQV